MRELAKQAGRDVCNEDILSLSVGKAVYPEDGIDAEKFSPKPISGCIFRSKASRRRRIAAFIRE